MLYYNYTAAEAYAKSCGLALQPERVAEFDKLASAHAFTQAQVDIAMQVHIRHVAFLFQPKSYGWKQRIVLALHFLFGRK